jgi:hypothetical protein
MGESGTAAVETMSYDLSGAGDPYADMEWSEASASTEPDTVGERPPLEM